jgi:hypothetical protein
VVDGDDSFAAGTASRAEWPALAQWDMENTRQPCALVARSSRPSRAHTSRSAACVAGHGRSTFHMVASVAATFLAASLAAVSFTFARHFRCGA